MHTNVNKSQAFWLAKVLLNALTKTDRAKFPDALKSQVIL